jgi:hypothetical protein
MDVKIQEKLIWFRAISDLYICKEHETFQLTKLPQIYTENVFVLFPWGGGSVPSKILCACLILGSE